MFFWVQTSRNRSRWSFLTICWIRRIFMFYRVNWKYHSHSVILNFPSLNSINNWDKNMNMKMQRRQ